MMQQSYLGATSSPSVARLQRALALLGLAVKDPALAVKADGITGPATAGATNRAMVKYVTAAPANLRTGKLTPANVAQLAAQLSSHVELRAKAAAPKAPQQKVSSRASKAQVQAMQAALRTLGSKVGDKILVITADGAVGPKTIAAVNKAVSSYGVYTRQVSAADLTNPTIVSAITSGTKAKTSSATKPVAPASSKPTKSPTVQRLQQAIAALGKKIKDKVLQIGADGLIGPKTAAAVNKALVGIASAPAQYRTGRLSQSEIVMNAEGLAKIVESHLAKIGVKPPALPSSSPKPGLSRSAAITQIQQSLGQLASIVGDPGLTVVVDGINGPKTTAAVNKVLGRKLSVAQVSAQAGSIVSALASVIASKGAAPTPVTEVPQPSPEPDQIVPATAETPAVAPATPQEQLLPMEQPAAQAAAQAASAASPALSPSEAIYNRQVAPEASAASPTAPADYAALPSASSGEQSATASEAAATPAPAAPSGRPTWHYVAGGAGLLGILGTLGYFAFREKKSQSRRYTAPRHFARRRLRTA